MATGTRLDMALVTVSVEGIGDIGVFDKMTGGEIDSEETKYSPGGMAPPVSLGGRVTMANIVLERNYVLERDSAIEHALIAAVGVANVTATKQPLDENRVPYGRPLVYSGVLKKCFPPDHDSNSSNAALLHLEFVPTGTVG
jgi:hypothetical protein